MARSSFLRRTMHKVLRGTSWLKSVGRYNERFPQIFRAGKWHPASEGSLWMSLFGVKSSPLSLVGTRRRGRNSLERLLRIEGLEQKQLLAADAIDDPKTVLRTAAQPRSTCLANDTGDKAAPLTIDSVSAGRQGRNDRHRW